MARVESYERNASYILRKAFYGKYLQCINNPKIILEIDDVEGDSRNLKLQAFNKLTGKYQSIEVNKLGLYVEISQSQYGKFVNDPSLLEDIILVHKNSSLAREARQREAVGHPNDFQLEDEGNYEPVTRSGSDPDRSMIFT
ncbi:MAG: hypothetical protein ACOCUU_01075 [Nanoarchaeota archaeon]